MRCRDCGHRYQEGIVWIPGMGYAKCPTCLREDLTDWEEKYAYPPRWEQALLHIGGKAHRCAVCRKNFVSFLARRREFVPSWRQKPKPDAGDPPEIGPDAATAIPARNETVA